MTVANGVISDVFGRGRRRRVERVILGKDLVAADRAVDEPGRGTDLGLGLDLQLVGLRGLCKVCGLQLGQLARRDAVPVLELNVGVQVQASRARLKCRLH